MFCSKCGFANADNSAFCVKCGSQMVETIYSEPPKVMLNPEEVIVRKEGKDSSKSFSGFGKVFGRILMILAILGDLVAMCAIGSDAFFPIFMGATGLFVAGLLMTLFSH